jgi:hypothetical protein
MSQGGNVDDYRANNRSGIKSQLENLSNANEAKREAENFTANLKQSIKSWMSAQQIINIVK